MQCIGLSVHNHYGILWHNANIRKSRPGKIQSANSCKIFCLNSNLLHNVFVVQQSLCTVCLRKA